jgi:hypothetical protein
MKNIFQYIFKVIFGIAIAFIGFQGLINIKQYVALANSNVDLIREQHFFKTLPLLETIKENTKNLVLIHYFFFLIGGFLSVLGIRLYRLVIFLAVIGNLIFINNVFVLKDDKTMLNALKYIALFGGAWNI